MRHQKRPRRGRADAASDDALFERALRGDGPSSEKRFDPRADRKTLQLCRQVQRALEMGFVGDLLRDVYVESVEPMGGPGQLRVNVIVPRHAGLVPAEVVARLVVETPRLRAAVAREVCRKRVPSLSFFARPDDAPEGGSSGE